MPSELTLTFIGVCLLSFGTVYTIAYDNEKDSYEYYYSLLYSYEYEQKCNVETNVCNLKDTAFTK